MYVGRPVELSISWVVFFGGTAPSRTYLPDLRLSEDIDLVCTSDRASTAARIEEATRRGLRRSIGRTTFTPSLTELRRADHSILDVGGARIQIQLLSTEGLIDAEAAALFRRHGPHTRVTDADFARPVTQDLWMSSLGHQCRPRVSAEEALKVVESAWRSAAHE